VELGLFKSLQFVEAGRGCSHSTCSLVLALVDRSFKRMPGESCIFTESSRNSQKQALLPATIFLLADE